MDAKVLVVEDDRELAHLLAIRLAAQGYQVDTAQNGCEALRAAYELHPDLVILDIMMPVMDGYETCRRLRELSDVPVIMLTALTSQENVLRGFEAGADDYLKKPFDFQELEMRMQALLKRAQGDAFPQVYDDGRLRVDLGAGQVYRDGKRVHLSPTEFRLLRALVSRQGCVVGHAELLTEVWGESYGGAVAELSLYIRYLREKLEDDPGEPVYIRTEWGRGYWFAESTRDLEFAV
jgi:two-component system KDP operon response regulator KdpE